MNDKETKEILGLALEGFSFEIERKCRLIAETCASYSNVRDLNKLIQQFLELKEEWISVSYDDEN